MSRYFVTSEPTGQRPFRVQDLRVRPPKKHSGILVATVACMSALCGGAAAYAIMASVDTPAPPVQVASLDGDAAIVAAANARAGKQEMKADETHAATTPASGEAEEIVSTKAVEKNTSDAALFNPSKISSPETVEPAPLTTDSPRWADDDQPAVVVQQLGSRSSESALVAALDSVDIAESEDEVVALERQMSNEKAQETAETSEPEETIKPVKLSAPSFSTADLVSARATKWVNMRASKNKHAAKLLVVPQGAQVRSDPACQHWCRVSYDGKLGYVYRTYLQFPGEAAVAAKSPEPATVEKKTGVGLLNRIKENFKPDP